MKDLTNDYVAESTVHFVFWHSLVQCQFYRICMVTTFTGRDGGAGGLGVAPPPPLLLSHGKRTYLNERRTTAEESGRTLLELLHLLFSDFPLAL